MQAELAEYEEALDAKRQERIASAKVDRKRLEEEAQAKMQAELQRIDEGISLKRQLQQAKIAEAMEQRQKELEARLEAEKEKLEQKRMAMNREECVCCASLSLSLFLCYCLSLGRALTSAICAVSSAIIASNISPSEARITNPIQRGLALAPPVQPRHAGAAPRACRRTRPTRSPSTRWR